MDRKFIFVFILLMLLVACAPRTSSLVLRKQEGDYVLVEHSTLEKAEPFSSELREERWYNGTFRDWLILVGIRTRLREETSPLRNKSMEVLEKLGAKAAEGFPLESFLKKINPRTFLGTVKQITTAFVFQGRQLSPESIIMRILEEREVFRSDTDVHITYETRTYRLYYKDEKGGPQVMTFSSSSLEDLMLICGDLFHRETRQVPQPHQGLK